MYILNVLRKYRNAWFGNPADHLLRIEINTASLLHNVHQFKKISHGKRIAAVLKSNAYGHGLKEVGSFLGARPEIDILAVDSIIEARILRDQGIKKSILILGYVPMSAIPVLKKLGNMILVVNGTDQAQWLSEHIKFPLTVHIKVDTGMNRQGVALSHLSRTIKMLRGNKYIQTEGMLSHLADADNAKSGYETQKQLEKWNEAVDIYRRFFSGGTFHFSATAGTHYLDTGENTLVRAGIGLYGIDTTPNKNLQTMPVLSLWAKIVNIKTVGAGEGIGYGFIYRAEKQIKTAVIPCGYYEGVPLSLGNKGYMYYRNIPLRIVGRVSMNLSVLDISEVAKDITLEDEVEVFSDTPGHFNTIENVASLSGTIPYEVLARLAPTIKRVLV